MRFLRGSGKFAGLLRKRRPSQKYCPVMAHDDCFCTHFRIKLAFIQKMTKQAFAFPKINFTRKNIAETSKKGVDNPRKKNYNIFGRRKAANPTRFTAKSNCTAALTRETNRNKHIKEKTKSVQNKRKKQQDDGTTR